jgi:hypothetical protein
LEQVALNLLTNAVKYGRVGGRIWLLVRRAPGQTIRLEVRDDGPGIRESEQYKVFERFHRLDTDETRRASGTGLGLPIARALTELHGGRIELRSEAGRGSTFVVTLPEACAPADVGAGFQQPTESTDPPNPPAPTQQPTATTDPLNPPALNHQRTATTDQPDSLAPTQQPTATTDHPKPPVPAVEAGR